MAGKLSQTLPLTYLQQRSRENWLINFDSQELAILAAELYQQLNSAKQNGVPPKVLFAELQPLKFLAGFAAAVSAGCPLFLGNPNWAKAEWQQAIELVKPNLILADNLVNCEQISNDNLQFANCIMIPTGGSSGKIRFAVHTWSTLTASVEGLQQYFNLTQINSVCALPLYHVSGLMQVARSLVTGGKLAILPFANLASGELPQIEPEDFFISLVPTQLQRLLDNNFAPWLAKFFTILLGGAPAWEELLQAARNYCLPIALTYGMTETASQVVTLKPKDFLAGNNSSGQVLPHAEITIRSDRDRILPAGEIGTVTISAQSLTLGYYPDWRSQPNLWLTDDLGFFDSSGYLHIVGRNSSKIITGGENVFPSEVEAAILDTGLVEDVCVVGLRDRYWGQVVVAVFVPKNERVNAEKLKQAIAPKLSKFKQPKHWLSVASLPRNQQGKINRQQVEKFVICRNS